MSYILYDFTYKLWTGVNHYWLLQLKFIEVMSLDTKATLQPKNPGAIRNLKALLPVSFGTEKYLDSLHFKSYYLHWNWLFLFNNVDTMGNL